MTGWPRYNRIAVQPAPYVGPGQVAWFQFTIQAPQTPGYYKLYLRPLVEGSTWMEDYGVFWQVTVLNPDGTMPPAPPPQALPGCREWPTEAATELNKLPIMAGLCLMPYLPLAPSCETFSGCYQSSPPRVWVRQQPFAYQAEMFTTAHEICHSHQEYSLRQSGGSRWLDLAEGAEFSQAFIAFKAQYPDAAAAWGDRGDYENFADVCGAWYYPFYYPLNKAFKIADFAPLLQFALKWLPK